MNKERVVVTGGAGFLGSHLCDALSEAGYAVTVFDRQPSPWLREGQDMVVGDILDEAVVNDTVKGARYVYHLAGIADIGEASVKPKDTLSMNVLGSANILEACAAHGVQRLLFASTVYVYSSEGGFYRVSKQAVEAMIELYQAQRGLDYTILRYGSLYGPRAQAWNGLKRYVLQAVREGRVVYHGTGEERREYIHVKDAVDLSVKVLAPDYANRCLTLTGTQVLNSAELLKMLGEVMGGKLEIVFEPHKKRSDHYSFTPYRYTPKQGSKIVPSDFIDVGQGLLDLVEEVHAQESGEEPESL